MIYLIGSAVLCGISLVLLIWGGRQWLVKKFDSDTAWVRDVALRF